MKKRILTMTLLVGAVVAMAVPALLGKAELVPTEAQPTTGIADKAVAGDVLTVNANAALMAPEPIGSVGVSVGTVEGQLYSGSGLNLDNFYSIKYVAQTTENTYWGFNFYEDGKLEVRALSSTEDAVTIPDSLIIDDVVYPVTKIYCNSYLYNGLSDKVSLTIPETIEYIQNMYWFNTANPYLLGDAPVFSSEVYEKNLYICKKSSFDGYITYDKTKRAFLMPYGWDFDWVTVNVERSGEFAETYLTQNNYDWGAAHNVKVVGNINDIDLKAIKNLTSIYKLDLTETQITAVPSDFMSGRKILLEVKLPDTVTTIGTSAFLSCTNLLSCEHNGVTSIETNAFLYCSSLLYFDLTGVETLGSDAFGYCYALSGVDLSTLKTIGSFAFESCRKLKSNVFSDSLKVINRGAFQYTSIETLNFPASLTSVGEYAFLGCVSLTKVEWPATLDKIADGMFNGCVSLTDVVLNKGLVGIGYQAFKGCTSLEQISIPSTVRTIGSRAFDKTNITSFTCYAAIPPVVTSSFIGDGMDMTKVYLYVLPFSKDFYRNTLYWSDFWLMSSINEQIDYIFIDRPLTINLEEEDNDVVANNPEVELSYVYDSSYNIGQFTATGQGTLSAGQLTINAQITCRAYDYYQYCPTLINYADKMRADNVTHNFYFNNSSSSGQWHFMSLPYDVKVSEIVPGEDTHWVIRRYDSEARAAGDTSNTWVDLTNDDTLEAGKGYIISSVSDSDHYRSTLSFTSGNSITKNNIFRSTDAIVPLTEYVAEFAHNRSWNLVGNPYPCYFDMHYLNDDFTAPITVWDGNKYMAYSPVDDDLVLSPYEAFFVQCPLDATEMTFKRSGRLHHNEGQPKYVAPGHTPTNVSAEDRNVFNFNLIGDQTEDRARIVFNNDALLEYEIGRDASKFFATGADAQIYVNTGVAYSIDERPVSDGNAVLGICAGQEAEYTLTLSGKYSQEWTVMLTDNVTGITVDLTEADYHFTTTADDNANRFSVRFMLGANGESGIQSVISELGDAEVTVTGVNGQVAYKGAVSGINVPVAGIYVITSNNKSYKVILK